MIIDLTRVFDASKSLATKSGQELTDFIGYTTDAMEKIIRALRNGLSFADNFYCSVETASVVHNTTAIVNATKRVIGVIPIQTDHNTDALISLNWRYNNAGRLTITPTFKEASSTARTIKYVLLY